MENFAKLAGIQDASTHMNPSQHTYSEIPPVPHLHSDLEAQSTSSLTPNHSRVSLPLDRRPSRKSVRSVNSQRGTNTRDDTIPPLPQTPQTHQQRHYTASRTSHNDDADSNAPLDDAEEELAWGPSHPCFPHPNPHVAPNSLTYTSTRIIRVQRDWLVAGDLHPALANMYPEILAEWVSEQEFRELIETLNGMLKEAFDPWSWRAQVDAVMGVVTGFLWDDAGFTGVKSVVKRMERYMEDWNRRKERDGKEVKLIPLRRNGFMNLDIQIPDPGIDLWLGDEDGMTGEEDADVRVPAQALMA